MSGRRALVIALVASALVCASYLLAQWLGCLPEPHANRITPGDVMALIVLVVATVTLLLLLKKR